MWTLISCSDSLRCCSSLTGSPSPKIEYSRLEKEKFSWFFRLPEHPARQTLEVLVLLYVYYTFYYRLVLNIQKWFIVEPGNCAPRWATPGSPLVVFQSCRLGGEPGQARSLGPEVHLPVMLLRLKIYTLVFLIGLIFGGKPGSGFFCSRKSVTRLQS